MIKTLETLIDEICNKSLNLRAEEHSEIKHLITEWAEQMREKEERYEMWDIENSEEKHSRNSGIRERNAKLDLILGKGDK